MITLMLWLQSPTHDWIALAALALTVALALVGAVSLAWLGWRRVRRSPLYVPPAWVEQYADRQAGR